jgi:hypothetical protein
VSTARDRALVALAQNPTLTRNVLAHVGDKTAVVLFHKDATGAVFFEGKRKAHVVVTIDGREAEFSARSLRRVFR